MIWNKSQPKPEREVRTLRMRSTFALPQDALSLHSDSIKSALDKEVQRTGANCRVRGTGCMGLCSLGPLVSE